MIRNLRDWAVKQKILADDMQGFTDILRAVYPLTFSGNVQTIGGGQQGTHVHVPFTSESGDSWFWAKITGFLAMGGASNRWQYSYTEQRLTAAGSEDLPSGRTGTTDTRFALNSIEMFNDGSGIEGNSIDHAGADYPAGFSLQPVRGSPVVQIWIGTDTDGNATYTFSYVNAEDGTCEAP